MAKLSTDLRSATLHPREALHVAGNLGALNAEVIVDCDGSGVVSLDLRGTFSLTVEVAGTVDGVNWTLIPVRPINVASVTYVSAVTGTAAGIWVGSCAGFRRVRARVTAYTSGAAATVLLANAGVLDPLSQGLVATNGLSATGTAGSAVTLTIPAPGAGLRQYVSHISIDRIAAALLTAAATPVVVTTTLIPGTPSFSFPADAAAQGSIYRLSENYPEALAATAQNTNATIVCPATTNVIWRATAFWRVAP